MTALNDLLTRLAQTLDAQRQFIADAAHELRTLLTAIRLQAEIAQRATTDAERAETLEALRTGLTRASHLVEQLLAMARLDAAQAPDRSNWWICPPSLKRSLPITPLSPTPGASIWPITQYSSHYRG
ncbi:MAG: histidine kinase dimerization/phospho-acceptor domain-containing protein [Candidatus Competibacteraceae bacterium]